MHIKPAEMAASTHRLCQSDLLASHTPPLLKRPPLSPRLHQRRSPTYISFDMSIVLRKITNHDIVIPNSRRPRSEKVWSFTVNGNIGINLGEAKNDASAGLDGPDDEFFQDCGTKITYRLQVDGYDIHSITKPAHYLQHGQTRRTVVSHVVQLAEGFIQWTQSLAVVPGRQRFGPTFIEIEHLYLMELKQVSKASFQVNLGIEELVDPHGLLTATTLHHWPTLCPDAGPPQSQIMADPSDLLVAALFGDLDGSFDYGRY